MFFFNRTSRWVLAPLAERLDQPDQPSAPLSSSNPLLRRILAGVEQLLQERRTLKQQASTLGQQVSELQQRLAERDDAGRWSHKVLMSCFGSCVQSPAPSLRRSGRWNGRALLRSRRPSWPS